MTSMVWRGRTWHLSTPPPSAARHLAGMATERGGDSAQYMLDFLTVVLGPGQLAAVEDCIHDGWLPVTAMADLTEATVDELSGRPLKAVVALSNAAVSQWSIIRGRLVRDGIADPLRDLPTLWSLLDAVEWMILESKKDEKETTTYWRSLYPLESGWSDAEEDAAADAFFGAFS